MKINVLGTKYTFELRYREDDAFLGECDGYCDKTAKLIVVAEKPKDNQLQNYDEYQKKVTRHEIIHAFLYESGLAENFEHNHFGHDETFVDWIAIQFPKIKKVFEEVNCI